MFVYAFREIGLATGSVAKPKLQDPEGSGSKALTVNRTEGRRFGFFRGLRVWGVEIQIPDFGVNINPENLLVLGFRPHSNSLLYTVGDINLALPIVRNNSIIMV